MDDSHRLVTAASPDPREPPTPRGTTPKPKRKKNSSELKQLHNLEIIVRNEETTGFVGFYLANKR
jgi:hypothetical protein